MSGMKETVLVLLCLEQAVGEMKLLLLGFTVDILELNGMWRVLKFILPVQLQCDSSRCCPHHGFYWLPLQSAALKFCYSSSLFRNARVNRLDLSASVDQVG
ncbi:hypothetical protein TNCV_2078301 [Trichonephila clavipes]|nr:hypothetical protein TNCV_2078301 [Trichonephila clavipes]